MKRILYILVFSPLFVSAQDYSTQLKLIDSLLSHYEKNDRLFASLTIAKGDKILFDKAYGYENLEENTKASLKTKYRIGSITKMFTSVMILQLVEEGKTTLTTALSKYYPLVRNANNITVQDLLCHQSGIYNFTNDSSYLQYNTQKKSKEELLSTINSFEPVFEPREKNEYSNSNYVLLGFIIEDITKKSYAENLEARIVNPLGLKNTYYGGKTDPAKNEAYSYGFITEWEKSSETDMSIPHGAGAILSTTHDLAIFMNGLFNNKLLTKPMLDSMLTLRRDYGLGIFQIPFYNQYSWGHTGGIDEFGSIVGYFADDIIIAYSRNASRLGNPSLDILKLLYEKEFTFPEFISLKVDPNILKRYEGTFINDKFPLEITIEEKNGVLLCQATGQPQFALDAQNDSTFTFDQAKLKIEFQQSETYENEVDLILYQMGKLVFHKKRKEE